MGSYLAEKIVLDYYCIVINHKIEPICACFITFKINQQPSRIFHIAIAGVSSTHLAGDSEATGEATRGI